MIDYTIIRSNRKTVAIQITADGQVLVRCPERMSYLTIHRFVVEKESWIQKHLENYKPQPQLPKFTQEQLQELAEEARRIIPPRCAHFARLLGVNYGRITIRAQHSRWGSCSSQGNLNFNCLLVLTPPEVLDYVIVHELCHRVHLNHSSAFWDSLAQVLPDYASQRKWLKDSGRILICRLPE